MKKISVCFQKMQKPSFPILTPIRLKLLLLPKERKKERPRESNPCFLVSLRTSNCGEIDIAYKILPDFYLTMPLTYLGIRVAVNLIQHGV